MMIAFTRPPGWELSLRGGQHGVVPDFMYTELLPLGPDETPYRRLTAEGVRDIAHLLRPGHLAQLRQILDDPEASPNDRFVALDLLKNAVIASGGILPGCQDTGTAIVKGKKGQLVFTGGGDEAAIARGVFETYRTSN